MAQDSSSVGASVVRLVQGSPDGPTVVITDCDHGSFDQEVAAARGADATLLLARASTPAQVAEAAIGADALVVQYAPVTADVFAASPRLRAVGRYGVGVDSIDVPAATAAGVAVCNVPDYGTDAVADHAIAMILSLVRGLHRLDRRTRRDPVDLTPPRPLRRVRDLTLGVLGLGRIGTATARRAQALGFTVIGNDTRLSTSGVTSEGVALRSLTDLVREADLVTVHVPLNDDTAHLLDHETLALLRPGAYVVNTSRGGVIDTEALLAALESGRLAGAALDVLEDEPVHANHPLARRDDVLLTPHLAWYSEHSFAELKERTIGGVLDVLAGTRPSNPINPEVLSDVA